MGPTTEEFESDGHRFVITRLSAIEQFQLTRKISPLVPPLAPLLMSVAGTQGMSAKDALPLLKLAEPFADAIASLKDEVAEQIFVMTLSSVKVETAPGTLMPLWVAGAKRSSVAELNELGKLLPLVLHVIQFNLGPFIAGLLTSHEEVSQASSGKVSPITKSGT